MPATLIDPAGGASINYQNPNWTTAFKSYCAETFSSIGASAMQQTAGVVILDFETANQFPSATAGLTSSGTAFSSTNTISPFATTDAISAISTTTGYSIGVEYRYWENSRILLSSPDASQGVFLASDRSAHDTMTSGSQGLVAGRVFQSPRAGGLFLDFDRNLSQFGVVLKANTSSTTYVICLFDRDGTLIAKYSQGISAGQALYFGVKSTNSLIRSVWVGQSTATNGMVIDDISFVPAPTPTTSTSFSFAGSGATNGWSNTSSTTLTTSSDHLTIQGTTWDSKIYRSITLPAGSYLLEGCGSGKTMVSLRPGWSTPPLVSLNLSQASDWHTDRILFSTPGGTFNLVVQVNASSGTANIQSLSITSAASTPYSPDINALQAATSQLPLVRGMVTGTNSSIGYTPLFDSSYYAELKTWGCNVVRLQLFPASYAAGLNQDFWTAWPGFLSLMVQSIDRAQSEGLKVILDLHEIPFTDAEVPPTNQNNWTRKDLGERFSTVWRDIAQTIISNNLTGSIWAYELLNEPLDSNQVPNPPRQLWPLAANAIRTIRTVDPNTWIVYDVGPGYKFDGFKNLTPLPDNRVVYSAHFYYPNDFTSQGVHSSLPNPLIGYDGDESKLVPYLQPASDFSNTWHVPIYIGEFSVVRWGPVPDTQLWLQDIIDLMEARQWSWTYFSWMGWSGWRLDKNSNYTPNSVESDFDDYNRSDRGQVIYNSLQLNN